MSTRNTHAPPRDSHSASGRFAYAGFLAAAAGPPIAHLEHTWRFGLDDSNGTETTGGSITGDNALTTFAVDAGA